MLTDVSKMFDKQNIAENNVVNVSESGKTICNNHQIGVESKQSVDEIGSDGNDI